MAARRGRGRRKDYRSSVRTLTMANYVLIVIVAGLVIYVMWPSIALAFQGQPPGKTLSGINSALTTAQITVINNAPDSYFERAGEMLLNLSIQGEAVSNGIYYAPSSNFQVSLNAIPQFPMFNYNGKPSVIYIGAISCLWCAENRWAMAMALSRFGSFNGLYVGYSAIKDADIPTLYWKPQDIRALNGSANFGNQYSSGYINFFSAEYDSNISAGFQFPATSDPIGYFASRAPNDSYSMAMRHMNATNAFSGTPFTMWGTAVNRGASGVVLGAPQNATIAQSGIPITYMTHQQFFDQLKGFNTTFAYEQYAVADVYVAELCPSINNAAPVCKLPAIQAYERKLGLA